MKVTLWDIVGDAPRRRTPDGRPIHSCCVCGATGVWGSNWSWFGSLNDEDNGFVVQKFCSDDCKKQHKSVTHNDICEAVEREHRLAGPIE